MPTSCGAPGREPAVTAWLIDKSALVRIAGSTQAEDWAARIERGLVRISTVTRLEVGFSARSAEDVRSIHQRPPLAFMPVEHLTPSIEERAVEVQLAARRARTPPSGVDPRPADRGHCRARPPDRAPRRQGLRPDRRSDRPTGRAPRGSLRPFDSENRRPEALVPLAGLTDAVDAAIAGQLAIESEKWTLLEPLRVWVGLHSGPAELRNGDSWIIGFQPTISGLEFDIIESFQNADGSRVASRFRVHGRNNGFLGTAPDQRPLAFTGSAIWAVSPDGTLLHNSTRKSFAAPSAIER